MSNLFLKWSSHQELLTSLDLLLEENSFVDITIAVEGMLLKAHKVILCASSPYFREILTSNPASPPAVIFMRDMKLVEMKAIIDFIYKGEVCVSQDHLPGILKSADALKITGLSNITWSEARMSNIEDADCFETGKCNPEDSMEEEQEVLLIGSPCTENPAKRQKKEINKPVSSEKPSVSMCTASAGSTLCSVSAVSEDTDSVQKSFEESQKTLTSVTAMATPTEMASSLNKPKFPCRKYTKEDLQQALDLVRHGQMGIKPAARAFNIPVATLNHAARRNKITSPMQQGGNHTLFKPQHQSTGDAPSKWDPSLN